MVTRGQCAVNALNRFDLRGRADAKHFIVIDEGGGFGHGATPYSSEFDRRVIGFLPYRVSGESEHVLAIRHMLSLREEPETIRFDLLDHVRRIETNVLQGPASRHGVWALAA